MSYQQNYPGQHGAHRSNTQDKGGSDEYGNIEGNADRQSKFMRMMGGTKDKKTNSLTPHKPSGRSSYSTQGPAPDSYAHPPPGHGRPQSQGPPQGHHHHQGPRAGDQGHRGGHYGGPHHPSPGFGGPPPPGPPPPGFGGPPPPGPPPPGFGGPPPPGPPPPGFGGPPPPGPPPPGFGTQHPLPGFGRQPPSRGFGGLQQLQSYQSDTPPPPPGDDHDGEDSYGPVPPPAESEEEPVEIIKIDSANKWEKSDLGDDKRKNKFLKLMGAARAVEKTGGAGVEEYKQIDHGRSTEEVQKSERGLQKLFHQGLENRNRRHGGLGFSSSSSSGGFGQAQKDEVPWEQKWAKMAGDRSVTAEGADRLPDDGGDHHRGDSDRRDIDHHRSDRHHRDRSRSPHGDDRRDSHHHHDRDRRSSGSHDHDRHDRDSQDRHGNSSSRSHPSSHEAAPPAQPSSDTNNQAADPKKKYLNMFVKASS